MKYESEIIGAFKFEKRLQASIAIYLSLLLLLMIGALLSINISPEIQQVFVIIIGLLAVTTLDAFRKALSSKSSELSKSFNQIVVDSGGIYVGGNYYINGDVNQRGETRQSLAEAATEIQQLLRQLEETNPSVTDAEKVDYVNIATPPSLKSRIANAAKSGSEAAVESLLDNTIYGPVMRAAVKGWMLSEGLNTEEESGKLSP